jgi:hypothetical protein
MVCVKKYSIIAKKTKPAFENRDKKLPWYEYSPLMISNS